MLWSMRAIGLLGVLGLLGTTQPVRAQEVPQRVVLHGFGTWAYGNTGAVGRNVYLGGLPQGDFRHSGLAMNAAATVSEKLSVHVQASGNENDDGTQIALEYAFAEYRLADHLGLRMGQVKHPFGIYTEVFSVGTLRPFLDLPQGVYGPVGFAGQSYKGIGLTGVAGGGAWSLDYDVYGGGNDLQKFAVPEAFLHGDSLQRASSEIELQSTRNVIGGRLVLHTPVQGLSVGASSYTGILNEPAANRVTVAAAQLEYRSNRFTFETELAHENQAGDEYATGYYAQAAYRLSPEWQLAGQYDYLKNTFVGVSSAAAPSLQYHKEGALALSRWFSRSLVLRAEYHRISGNRFAMPHPEDLLGAVNAGTLRTTTDLVQVGGQFSF